MKPLTNDLKGRPKPRGVTRLPSLVRLNLFQDDSQSDLRLKKNVVTNSKFSANSALDGVLFFTASEIRSARRTA